MLATYIKLPPVTEQHLPLFWVGPGACLGVSGAGPRCSRSDHIRAGEKTREAQRLASTLGLSTDRLGGHSAGAPAGLLRSLAPGRLVNHLPLRDCRNPGGFYERRYCLCLNAPFRAIERWHKKQDFCPGWCGSVD